MTQGPVLRARSVLGVTTTESFSAKAKQPYGRLVISDVSGGFKKPPPPYLGSWFGKPSGTRAIVLGAPPRSRPSVSRRVYQSRSSRSRVPPARELLSCQARWVPHLDGHSGGRCTHEIDANGAVNSAIGVLRLMHSAARRHGALGPFLRSLRWRSLSSRFSRRFLIL